MRIYGRVTSVNVRKVLWTCDEVGQSYEREDWGGPFRSTREPEFLAMNPNGLVPVLQDENGVLWESNSICRYLANKAGRTDLLPSAPHARAVVEQWMDWQATELSSSWTYAFLGLVRRDPACSDAGRIAASLAKWNKAMAVLEGQLAATGAYVAGVDFTVADIVIGLSVNRWRMTPHDHPDFPAIAAYYDRLTERPAFMAHGPNGHA